MTHLISIMGSMASGKTSLSKKLIEFITNGEKPTEVIAEKVYYTHYKESKIAVLGKIGKNACTGLDSVYSKIGSDGVAVTIEHIINNTNTSIIVCEFAFFTMGVVRHWYNRGVRKRFKHHVFYLNFDYWHNLRRLSQRKAKKHNENCSPGEEKEWQEIYLPDTVYKNVLGKNSEQKNIFAKLQGHHEVKNLEKELVADYTLEIDTNLPQEQVFKIMIKELYKNI